MVDAAALRMRHILSRADSLGVPQDLHRLRAASLLHQDKPAVPWLPPWLLPLVARARRSVPRTKSQGAGAVLVAVLGCTLYAWLWWWPLHRGREVRPIPRAQETFSALGPSARRSACWTSRTLSR
jgi:hypothetical protein